MLISTGISRVKKYVFDVFDQSFITRIGFF
ncbi:MAG: hypothetical protein KatS3mg101_0853 [Patescibacteria group bacterium]|nr:MAG: hypothetical protein KatS3mg101_0853 [Patescibacteria group bacterium]